jgi:hypothetical protein
MRTSYLVTVALAWCLNGWAILYHLAYVPGFEGLILAVLLANIFAAPIVIWAAFVYGEIAEEDLLLRKASQGRGGYDAPSRGRLKRRNGGASLQGEGR